MAGEAVTPQLEIPPGALKDGAQALWAQLSKPDRFGMRTDWRSLERDEIVRIVCEAAAPHLLDWFAERLTSDEAVRAAAWHLRKRHAKLAPEAVER